MIDQREKTGARRHDFMDLLIELKNKGVLENETDAQTCNSEDAQAAKEIGKLNQGAKENLVSFVKKKKLKKFIIFVELDENAIAAQAFVFFAAGYETSSNTIAFCLHELALNQEIQEKTRREIHNVIEARDNKLTYDAVQEMKYLDMVILGTHYKIIHQIQFNDKYFFE